MESDADTEPSSPSTGDFVADREDADPDPAVVVNKPPVAAEEWNVGYTSEGDPVTAADENPEYDPKSEVVIVAFHADLVESHPDWSRDEGSLRLADAECKTYAFPPGRLQKLTADDLDDLESNQWR
mgnify:CR=1 FL=1